MNWYYLDQRRQRVGPFDETEIPGMIAEGRIAPATLVWNESATDWTRAAETDMSIHFGPRKPPAPPPLPLPKIQLLPPRVPKPSHHEEQRRRLIELGIAGGGALTLVVAFLIWRGCSQKPPVVATSAPTSYLTEIMKLCPSCGGRGKVQKTCQSCRGAGTIQTPSGYVTTCPHCQGTALVTATCPDCRGTGRRRGS